MMPRLTEVFVIREGRFSLDQFKKDVLALTKDTLERDEFEAKYQIPGRTNAEVLIGLNKSLLPNDVRKALDALGGLESPEDYDPQALLTALDGGPPGSPTTPPVKKYQKMSGPSDELVQRAIDFAKEFRKHEKRHRSFDDDQSMIDAYEDLQYIFSKVKTHMYPGLRDAIYKIIGIVKDADEDFSNKLFWAVEEDLEPALEDIGVSLG